MTDRHGRDVPDDRGAVEAPPLPDAWMRTLGDELTPPGATPSEAIWRQIERRIGPRGAAATGGGADSSATGGRTSRSVARWAWGLAASVILLGGIAIGRASAPAPVASPGGGPGGPGGVDARIVRSVAARHLTSSETLLTFVAADLARGDAIDASLADRGRRLLSDTRMLLRVAPRDRVELRALLEDLELVLTQLVLLESAGFDDARRAEERRILEDGLGGSDLVPRIQAVLPILDAPRRPMTSTD